MDLTAPKQAEAGLRQGEHRRRDGVKSPVGRVELALASFRCLISAAPETSRASRTGHKRSAAQRCETEP
jgi:hypothetical protein